MASDIVNKTTVQVLKLVKSGKLSMPEVYAACAKRREQIKPLNAFISQCSTDVDSVSQPKSPLMGLPFSVKDNFCTRMHPTTCASNILRDFVPQYDATVVKKLRDAGGTLMGKTNMDEFAMGSGTVDSVFGPVKNPWNYDFTKSEDDNDWYISGGSSGGSAVAVATGSSLFALGSDTGGSVRCPAALCGIVGLKPSYGSLSRHGLISFANAMDVPGIFARCVDDVALIFNILSGHDPMDSTTTRSPLPAVKLKDVEDVEGLVVGIPQEYHGPHLSTEILDAWNWAAGKFDDAGAKVIPVSLPNTQHSILCYYILSCGDMASNMARYDGIEFGHRAEGSNFNEMLAQTRTEGFGETVKQRILAGNYFLLKDNYRKYYEQALRVRRLISEDFKSVFSPSTTPQQQHVDVLLTPVTVSTATKYREFIRENNHSRCAEHDIYTQPANMSGVPGVSIPVCLDSNGLPISLQLMSGMYDEGKLLRAAKFIQQEANFSELELKFT